MSRKNKKKHLQSEYWKQLKLVKLQQQGSYCSECSKLSKHLDLYHLHYRTLGYEQTSDVVLLCRKCHQEVHDKYGYDRKTNYYEE